MTEQQAEIMLASIRKWADTSDGDLRVVVGQCDSHLSLGFMFTVMAVNRMNQAHSWSIWLNIGLFLFAAALFWRYLRLRSLRAFLMDKQDSRADVNRAVYEPTPPRDVATRAAPEK